MRLARHRWAMDLATIAANPQAAATIEAARISAHATARSAWIQGGAAVGAITAGALAYLGAVRQVRLQERAHEARAVAYRFRLSKVVEGYLAQITEASTLAKQQLERFRANCGSVPITSLRTAKPQTLHDENWEAHALLGRRAVELILVIDETSMRLARFDREISTAEVRTDAAFESATPRAAPTVDHTAAYSRGHAIVDYVEVLDRLRRALTDLHRELSRQLHDRSWWERWRRIAATLRR